MRRDGGLSGLVREAGTDGIGKVEEGLAIASERERMREREGWLREKERVAAERRGIKVREMYLEVIK